MYLYVATNRRVLMYPLVAEVDTLKLRIVKEFWKKKLIILKGMEVKDNGILLSREGGGKGASIPISNDDIEFVSSFEREWRETQQWNFHWD